MAADLESLWNIAVEKGHDGPPETLDSDARRQIEDVRVGSKPAAMPMRDRYVPADPNLPWRDLVVQQGCREFIKQVLLPWWMTNHPHKPCSAIRVDEWGRMLCRYIWTNGGVDGPWENPTHFLFYAYNNYQTDLKFGIRLKTFLAEYCNIYVN